ncbi:MAG TPA: hypothetical protein DCR16_06050 [Lachnospiraceae bacterium]|nr:hypothetical protein [Lachnospiraceae bacterium]
MLIETADKERVCHHLSAVCKLRRQTKQDKTGKCLPAYDGRQKIKIKTKDKGKQHEARLENSRKGKI